MINKLSQQVGTLLERANILRKCAYEATMSIKEIDIDQTKKNYVQVKEALKLIKESISDIDVIMKQIGE